MKFSSSQDLLFKNNGDGTFTDVTAKAGLMDQAVGMAAAWGDYDNDGDLDLFVANEGQDFLYRNNGDGTFNEVAEFSGLTDMASGRAAAWVDFNQDGNLDLFVANADGGNFLYRNPGHSGPPYSSFLLCEQWHERLAGGISRPRWPCHLLTHLQTAVDEHFGVSRGERRLTTSAAWPTIAFLYG